MVDRVQAEKREVGGELGVVLRGGHGVGIRASAKVPPYCHDWKQQQPRNGLIVVRHPDLGETVRMADAFGTDVHMFAQ